MTEWESVIGLECHVELNTKTKMFCGCRNEFGAEPNTLTCPVCVGHPGALPVPNREAIASIIKIGLALDCRIAPHSLFHRKNYFYPDMPKNFQISQYDLPICIGGGLDVDLQDQIKRFGITRVHMEEDTGKTTHGSVSGRIHQADHALVDYNRAGVPLVECVSEPDMRSPQEAAAYLRELRAVLESLEVSDVRMEEGSLRCDANVSLRERGAEEFGTKVEIKNMNSIRSLERALAFEIARQAEALEAGPNRGEKIVQETRHWDEDSGSTKSMRSKEEAFDYRYFPEPDIPPLEPSERWIEEIRATLPELPRARRARYREQHGLKPDVADVLVGDRYSTELFERSVALGAPAGPVANWITQDLAGLRNRAGVGVESKVEPEHLIDLIQLIANDELGGAGAKLALEDAFESGQSIAGIVERRGLRQVSDTGALQAIADEVIADNPDVVAQFKAGKEATIGFLVGQVMKKSGGTANPKLAQQVLRERLKA